MGEREMSLQQTEFTTSITRKEAECILIQRFYKSQQINWVPLEEASEISQAQQKPIHAISVDGPLAPTKHAEGAAKA